MKINIGLGDRIVRIAAVMVIAAFMLLGKVEGVTLIILGAVAVILLLTSIVRFCPLYMVCRTSTDKQS
ncbi:MAG: DUF2892 domain-containing protein [Bacteroidota bacterium]